MLHALIQFAETSAAQAAKLVCFLQPLFGFFCRSSASIRERFWYSNSVRLSVSVSATDTMLCSITNSRRAVSYCCCCRRCVQGLNAKNMYNGCNLLRVDFSKLPELTVRFNNDKTRDFTNPLLPAGESQMTSSNDQRAAAASALAAAVAQQGRLTTEPLTT